MTFYTKPEIRYFARPAFLFVILLPLVCFTVYADVLLPQAIREATLAGILGYCFLLLVLNIGNVALTVVYWRHMHEKYWAKITFTNTEIIWRCVLKKSHRIRIADLRCMGVDLEEAHNGLDYPFIYFSKVPYLEKYRNKINRLSVTDDFIKFWYTEDLAAFLIANFPKEKSGAVQYYREKQRRELRERQKKKR